LIWKHETLSDSYAVQQERLCQAKAANRPMRGFDIGFREAKIYNECMYEQGFYKTYKRPPVFVADDWVTEHEEIDNPIEK